MSTSRVSIKMRILGLTGSIATGKSTAVMMLRRLGFLVYDSDAAVHTLLDKAGSAVPAVAAVFPNVIINGIVDRAALSAMVFCNVIALHQLEAILHPLVYQGEQRFLRCAAARRETLVVLDIPLLFETCGERRCDAVVVMTTPLFLQRQRALQRSGMTADKLKAIQFHQVPEAEKRRQADFIVPGSLGRHTTLRYLLKAIIAMHARPVCHWPPRLLPRMSRRGCHYA